MDRCELKSNYEAAEEWCSKVVKGGHELLFDVDIFDVEMKKASKKFEFPAESLNSFLRNIHLKRLKKHTFVIRNALNKQIIPEYIKGKSILELSKIYNFPPALLSRSIIEKITDLPKKKISEALRDPMKKLNSIDIVLDQHRVSEEVQGPIQVQQQQQQQQQQLSNGNGNGKSNCISSMKHKHRLMDPFSGELIEYSNQTKDKKEKVTRIAKEVQEAIYVDPLYGPRSDRIRQIMGTEYEIILEQTLHSMKIPFETERELKKRGTSKTPDILFSCPVGIKVPKDKKSRRKKTNIMSKHDGGDSDDDAADFEWKMICWIDSKALFGDVYTHQKSVLPQAEGYVHRFGPGLVLYWFGHAPRESLSNGHGDVYVKGWKVPSEIMMPTGDISRVSGWTNSHLVDTF